MAYMSRRTFSDAYDKAREPNFRGRTLAGMGIGAVAGYAIAGPAGGAVGGVIGGGVGLAIGGAEYVGGFIEYLADIEKPDTASRIVSTRAAFTMRQATIQAMHDSAYNLNAVLGNEASLLHR